MKKMWKVLLVMLLLTVTFIWVDGSVWAAETTQRTLSQEGLASGKCGESLNWVLTADGEMTISGTGKMWDFMNDSSSYDYHERPWEDYKEQIQTVIFQDGITYIGAGAFSYCGNLENVIFSDTILLLKSEKVLLMQI